jgi:PAS domain S-box-containing protein
MQVLVVEDNPGDVDLLRTLALEGGPVSLEFESVARLRDAIDHLRVNPVDLVLLDLGLPDSQGLDTFHAIKKAAPHLPVVLLTGNEDRGLGVEAVKAGAQDYLVKGQVQGPLLVRAMTYAIERKRAQEELREHEEQFRNLFETTQDSVFIVDRQTLDIVDANPAAYRLYGYSRDEFLGMKISDISAQREETESTIRSGTTTVLLRFHRKKSGAVFPVEISGGYFTLRCRALHTGFVRDISERRQLQASMAQSDRLASMGMLAAGVAHEINNPLSYVLYNIETLAEDLSKLAPAMQRCCGALRERVGNFGFAVLAGDGADALRPVALEDLLHRAREALSGAQRIKEIARGLGTFSRVERVEQTKIDLRYAIECAASMSFNEIKYRAKLIKDFGQVPAILGSEGKLSQVFLNLLINAAHAIPDGDVERNRIEIRTWADDEHVFAEVKDTGKGIPPEDLARIFEPFFTTKAAGIGSGLGLAICKDILTEIGGDIQVDSEVGRGTRFIVRLPVPRDSPEARRAHSGVAMPEASALCGRILVVDDEDAIRGILQRMLGRAHEVVAAASGEEARAIIEKDSSFDLIVCDLMMPSMSGMDLHQWLVAHHPGLARQVVFLSGGAFTPKASAYLASVDNLRLDKPVDRAELLRVANEKILACKRRAC